MPNRVASPCHLSEAPSEMFSRGVSRRTVSKLNLNNVPHVSSFEAEPCHRTESVPSAAFQSFAPSLSASAKVTPENLPLFFAEIDTLSKPWLETIRRLGAC